MNNLLKYIDKNFVVDDAEKKSEGASAVKKEADD